MHAKAGDWLVVLPTASGERREGQIVSVLGKNGLPPYRVHWIDNDHETLFAPAPDTEISSYAPHSHTHTALHLAGDGQSTRHPRRDERPRQASARPMTIDARSAEGVSRQMRHSVAPRAAERPSVKPTSMSATSMASLILFEEFKGRFDIATIDSVLTTAAQQLQESVHPEALPEMAFRLAQFRLGQTSMV